MPKKCEPTCKFFRCAKRALVVKYPRPFGGAKNPVKPLTFCKWVGDYCQGPDCQYAFCARKALLPDGTCSLSERRASRTRSIEEEARREQEEFKLRLKGKELKYLRDEGLI